MPEAKFIREVWAENLEEEMVHLRDLVEDYPYLAMVWFLSLSTRYGHVYTYSNSRSAYLGY